MVAIGGDAAFKHQNRGA